MFSLPFQEIVETTTVPEITTVAEIIEEGDSDGDDSVRLKIIYLTLIGMSYESKNNAHL